MSQISLFKGAMAFYTQRILIGDRGSLKVFDLISDFNRHDRQDWRQSNLVHEDKVVGVLVEWLERYRSGHFP